MTKDHGPGTSPAGSDPGNSDPLRDVFARVRQGDEVAFAEFYDLTSARVHGLILSVLRAPDLAAEVTQEVYVEIWRQAARWSPDKGSLRAWMHTIAHRRAVDRVRSAQKESERDGRWAGSSGGSEPDQTWEGVEHLLDVEGVRSALAALTTAQREAVSLAYYGGYSHREVADMLGLPLGTVKTRIRDGLLGLRSTMGAGA